jgi:vitamin B12/bleomycin/antimicrobial peptide transport system ATP-binding/permease protein
MSHDVFLSLTGRSLLGKVWALVKPYWSSDERWAARGLLASIVAMALFMVFLDVQFNSWNNNFYNALQEKQSEDFWALILWFSFLAAVYIAVAGYNRYLNLWLQLRWRRWLTDHYLADWLRDRVHYRIELKGYGTDNVDQRIQEDLKDFASLTLSLGLDLLSSVVTLVTFANILWVLSGPITLPIFGGVTIHGYMMWVAFAYALIGSRLTHVVGRALAGLNYQQQRYEANFRFDLVRLRENSESIAALRGEADEQRNLLRRFQDVWRNFSALMQYSKRLTWFVTGYRQIAIIFPFMVVAPRYFAGDIKFGVIFQTASAFGQVQGALSWFVTAYGELAQWRATLDRLTSFHEAIEAARSEATSGQGIQVVAGAGPNLTLEDVSIALPNGRVLLAQVHLRLIAGENTLISGASGVGKSTLFRALSGIWPFGEGRVVLPMDARLMFLPQRPYLPIGSLREAVAYPADPAGLSDEVIAAALRDSRLPELATQLDESAHWAQRLSPGEQQRLGVARALLNQPDWLFLDEATSALDANTEQHLYRLLGERLPQTTLISIAHQPTLAAFHARKIVLTVQGEGAVVSDALPAAG